MWSLLLRDFSKRKMVPRFSADLDRCLGGFSWTAAARYTRSLSKGSRSISALAGSLPVSVLCTIIVPFHCLVSLHA